TNDVDMNDVDRPDETSDGSAPGDDRASGAPSARPRSHRRPRGTQLRGFVTAIGIGAVLVVAFSVLAAWARQGYFVAFDDDDNVVIYQGRELLWFQPTAEAPGKYGRAELDDESIALVDARPEFETQASAADFIAFRLTTTTTTTPTTTTTTTTTTTPTTTPTTTTAGTDTSSGA
ncbi:MAG: hypothetical protein RLZZ01_643, partial [Actinomycetota bacterium]